MKSILLISTRVFHYRVSVYNYFSTRFAEIGWDFKVASDSLQRENQLPLRFDYREIPFSFSAYRRLVREVKPEVVMFHMHVRDPIFWLLLHWLKLRGTPVICWTKGANLDKPDSRLRYEMFNHFHGLSDAILLYSANQLRYIRPRFRRKVFIANNTVNFEDYPVIVETKEAIKAEFGIPFRKIILFAGTMGIGGERKKVEHLVRVMAELDGTSIGAVLVGGGMSPQLRARINPNNTLFLGHVHDARNEKISKLFKAADVFVVPGHVGLGINQAFFWGLPVVTEAGRQPPEIQYLVDGRNGFIVPENDLAELKSKILYLLENDAVREEFSRNARADILAKASIARFFESFHHAVLFATGQPPPAPPA